MGTARAARADELVTAAAAAGVPLAALGGAAVQLLCASARPAGAHHRAIADVDVATTSRARPAVDGLARELGYAPDEPFNRAHGAERMRYLDADGSHLDVFVDELRLCHLVRWGTSLKAGEATLPMRWLLLTKLQIVRAEPKDLGDLAALLDDRWDDVLAAGGDLDHRLRRDWGLLRTASANLERLTPGSSRAAELLGRWQALPLTPAARLRGLVGERVRWYDEPEEV
ncbi:hypothetical protein ACIB24_15045 [Spongisporangium articulatum]|uniref:Nucleotidyltransferase family protein n=1 Tax=Spongisporangium articulatum TaxID=3362603 RepID=A0ABW8APU8_9ACTN